MNSEEIQNMLKECTEDRCASNTNSYEVTLYKSSEELNILISNIIKETDLKIKKCIKSYLDNFIKELYIKYNINNIKENYNKQRRKR